MAVGFLLSRMITHWIWGTIWGPAGFGMTMVSCGARVLSGYENGILLTILWRSLGWSCLATHILWECPHTLPTSQSTVMGPFDGGPIWSPGRLPLQTPICC